MIELSKKRIVSLIPEITSPDLKQINKGYSFDRKYIAEINGEKVLLRLYHMKSRDQVRDTQHIMQQFNKLGVRCPKVYAYGEVPQENVCYTIFSFVEGEDGEVALPFLTENEQYRAGYEAGLDLRTMHELPVEASIDTYMIDVEEKFERAVEKYRSLPTSIPHDSDIISYVRTNIGYLGKSKLVYAHHDLNASNVIIHNKTYAGIIDFNRSRIDTAYSEFDKVELFTTRVSLPFSKGIIDGYFQGIIPEHFWTIRSIHMAQLLIFHVNWVTDYFPANLPHVNDVVQNVIETYEDFNRDVPIWYEKSQL